MQGEDRWANHWADLHGKAAFSKEVSEKHLVTTLPAGCLLTNFWVMYFWVSNTLQSFFIFCLNLLLSFQPLIWNLLIPWEESEKGFLGVAFFKFCTRIAHLQKLFCRHLGQTWHCKFPKGQVIITWAGHSPQPVNTGLVLLAQPVPTLSHFLTINYQVQSEDPMMNNGDIPITWKIPRVQKSAGEKGQTSLLMRPNFSLHTQKQWIHQILIQVEDVMFENALNFLNFLKFIQLW